MAKKMTRKDLLAACKLLGIDPPKTLAQIKAEHKRKARALSTETKRAFHVAIRTGRTIGEAMKLAGITDDDVLGPLVDMGYKKVTHHVAIDIEDIV